MPLLPLEITLNNVRLMLRIGIHDHERKDPQPVLVSVSAQGRIPLAPRGIDEVMDYERIRDYLQSWPRRPHTELLESLAVDLMDFIFQDPRVGQTAISLVKPEAFPEVEGAGIHIRLSRTEWEKLKG